MAFDDFEPVGTRTLADLLALLTTSYLNVHRKPGSRPLLPQDLLDNPLLPRRTSAGEETSRRMTVMADYRRLRAERLAKASQSTPEGKTTSRRRTKRGG